jgi:hypothetical protein
MTRPTHDGFMDAMSWCFLGVIAAAGIVVGFCDFIETAAKRWYLDQSSRAPQQPRPWYVRFHEFTQQ